jgi:hypothetical protein
MATKTFTSAARRATTKTIDFDLDGDTYHFTPIKTAALILSGFMGGGEQLKTQLNWLSDGLPDNESDRIQARLLDADDPLDIDHLLGVVTWLLEEMSGRPTTPSPE